MRNIILTAGTDRTNFKPIFCESIFETLLFYNVILI